MKQKRGQPGNRGQFARDTSGAVAPSAANPRVVNRAAPAGAPTPTGGDDSPPSVSDIEAKYEAFRGEPTEIKNCPTCGRFTSDGAAHDCVKPMSAAKQTAVTIAPAVAAAGTFGVTAAALSLGPVAVGVVAAGLVVGFVIRSLAKKLFTGALWHQATDSTSRIKASMKRTEREKDAFKTAETQVDALAEQLQVPGQVAVLQRQNGSPAAIRIDKNRSLVIVTPDLLRMPPEQMRGILAHEVAHLQPAAKTGTRAKHFLSRAALPAGFGAAAVSGLAALPAAALAAGVWYAGKAASSAASRREERRADRVAYQTCGEHFADALHQAHKDIPGTVRHDLPWRAEDVIFSHGNLPNRVADMRR